MKVRRSHLIAVALIAMNAFLIPAVHADNSTIPSWMFSSRQELLKEREDLLAHRADATAELTRCEVLRRQCDTLLNSNLSKKDHDAIVGARDTVGARINDYVGWKAAVDSDLMANATDLRILDDKMKAWACLK